MSVRSYKRDKNKKTVNCQEKNAEIHPQHHLQIKEQTRLNLMYERRTTFSAGEVLSQRDALADKK